MKTHLIRKEASYTDVSFYEQKQGLFRQLNQV